MPRTNAVPMPSATVLDPSTKTLASQGENSGCVSISWAIRLAEPRTCARSSLNQGHPDGIGRQRSLNCPFAQVGLEPGDAFLDRIAGVQVLPLLVVPLHKVGIKLVMGQGIDLHLTKRFLGLDEWATAPRRRAFAKLPLRRLVILSASDSLLRK